jgi:hypothetical protein
MLAASLLFLQRNETQILPIDLPNIVWVNPAPEEGCYVVATQEENKYQIHWWPERLGRKPLHVTSAWIVGADGTKRAHIYGYNPLAILDFERWTVNDANGRATAWQRGQTVQIERTPEGKTTLLFGKKSITPPTGQEFILLSDDGEYVVTERLKEGVSGPESNYYFTFELWKIGPAAIQRVRSLGDIWYDGASTGAPSVLSVSGNGLVVFDCPAGGGVIQEPVLVGLDGKQRSLRSLAIESFSVYNGSPTSFETGILLPVAAFEHVEPDGLEFPGYKYTNWLVWYSNEGAFGLVEPVGFLNVIKTGPMSAVMAVRVKGGVELRPLALPPKNWYKIDISKVANFRGPWGSAH